MALALPVSFLGGRPAASVPGPSTVGAGSRVYVVQPGDTLWSIATRLVGPAGDPRPVVAQLQAENHGATIVPGAVLRLP